MALPGQIAGQQAVKRIVAQDPSLDNLVEPPGYPAAPLGTLGGVVRRGTGPQAMILIPGLGFGGDVFSELMGGLGDGYRMYAVTLPGFGDSAAPPSPGEKTSFGEQTWTNAAIGAIETLIRDEQIVRPILVGHWLTGTQIALRLAMKHPDQVKAVVILAGTARMSFGDARRNEAVATLEKRIPVADAFAQRWFKTVTRETWDDNNFLPGDYAVHPVLGLRLWRQAAAPRLHVWVRYLCEFNAQDISLEMGKLTVPTLFLQPGLEGLPFDPGQNYMDAFLNASWASSLDGNPRITVKTIPNSRALPWLDQPAAVNRAIVDFLAGVEAAPSAAYPP